MPLPCGYLLHQIRRIPGEWKGGGAGFDESRVCLRCHEHDVDFWHGRDVCGRLHVSEHAASRCLDQSLKRDETGGNVGERADADLGGTIEYGWAGQELDTGAEDGLERVEPAVKAQAAQSLGGRHLRLLVIAAEHAVPDANGVSAKKKRPRHVSNSRVVLQTDGEVDVGGSERRKLDTGEEGVLIILEHVVFDGRGLRQLEESPGWAASVHVSEKASEQGRVCAGGRLDCHGTPHDAGGAAQEEERGKGDGGCSGS